MDQEKKVEEKVPEKKQYSSPILWVYGGIAELTQSSGMTGSISDTRGLAMDSRTT
jgi:hypothetical protein